MEGGKGGDGDGGRMKLSTRSCRSAVHGQTKLRAGHENLANSML